ncbi:MAG: MFS transporter [Cyanobacteria bacterium J06638_22]
MSDRPEPFLKTWGPPIGLCLTLFAVAYSVGAVPAIMPRIVRDLDSSVGYVQGALVLLALVKASFAPTSENLVRRYGRKPIYFVGLSLFSIGLVATALSPNMGMFVVSYSLLSGLGATPLLGSPRDLVDRLYDDNAEKYGLLALAIASILGGLAGSLLGGRIASVWGWRWSLIPVLAIVPVIMWVLRSVPRDRLAPTTPIDWFGGLLSFLGFGLALLGISLVGEYGWWEPKQPLTVLDVVIPPSSIISIVPPLILVGVICLGFYGFWRRLQARRNEAALLRAGLLRHRPFLLGLLTATLHTLLSTGIQFNLYQFIPAYLGLNPFWTAIALLPYSLALLVVIIFATFKIVGRYPYKLILYTALTLFCLGILALYRAIQPTMTLGSLLPALIVMGSGSGLFLAQIGIATFANASPQQRAEASGIYTPFQNLGSALGRAILGTALIATASIRIVDRAIATLGETVAPEQRQEAIATLTRVIQTYTRTERRDFFDHLPAAIQPSLNPILNAASIEAMQTATLIALGLSVLCLVSAFFLPRRPIVNRL